MKIELKSNKNEELTFNDIDVGVTFCLEKRKDLFVKAQRTYLLGSSEYFNAFNLTRNSFESIDWCANVVQIHGKFVEE